MPNNDSRVRTLETSSDRKIHLVWDVEEADVIACTHTSFADDAPVVTRRYDEVTCEECRQASSNWWGHIKKIGDMMKRPRIGQ